MFNDLKFVKAISQLDPKEDNMREVSHIVVELKLENSKLKADTTSLQERLNSAEESVIHQEHELRSLQHKHDALFAQNVQLVKLNEKLRDRLEEGAL